MNEQPLQPKSVNDISHFELRIKQEDVTLENARLIFQGIVDLCEAVKEELGVDCKVTVFKKRNVFEQQEIAEKSSILLADATGRIKFKPKGNDAKP